MKNKQQKGKRGIKRLAISMLVCVAMLTSLITPIDALSDTSGVSIDNVVQLCDHIHGPECYAVPEGHTCSEATGCLPVFPTKTITVPHVHDEDCFEQVLVSGYEHGDECWEEQTTQICGMEEGDGEVVEHTSGYNHNEGCFDEEGGIICDQNEMVGEMVIVTPGHIHTDACFETTLVLICDQDELPAVFEQGDLICGLEQGTEVEVEVTDYDAEPISWICGALERVCEHRDCVFGEPCLAVTTPMMAPVAIAPLGAVPTWADATHFAGNDTELRNIISGAASGETRVIGITNSFNVGNNAQPVVDRNIEIPAGITIILVAENAVELPVATSLLAGWRHFVVYGELTLTDGITLIGGTGNQAGGGVQVNGGGTLNMYGGTISRGSPVATPSNMHPGGGVYVRDNGMFNMHGGEISAGWGYRGGGVYVQGGTFTMHDGEIIGNTAAWGSGVYVNNSGTFTMHDGTISDNTFSSNPGNRGGGVAVRGGSAFTMNGGAISDNNVESGGRGGGVYVNNSTFTMTDGEIIGHTLGGSGRSSSGGGVSVWNNGEFTMTGGTISDNTIFGGSSIGGVSLSGGGVQVWDSTFTMTDGEISGNTVRTSGNGGGVQVVRGEFTMNAGSIINDNTANGGGGVHVSNESTFAMNGGEINGNTNVGRLHHGGGVTIASDSTFTMHDGVISGNTTGSHGGGVYVTGDSAFTMHDGVISGNTAESDTINNGGGGGVNIMNGTFTMHDGVISDNRTENNGDGGGVFLRNASAFTMHDGVISGNHGRHGGGVHLEAGSTLMMHDGVISGNTTRGTGVGGGVNVVSGMFTMENGTISGNEAHNGGGIFLPLSSRANPTLFSISDTVVFYGNVARSGAFDHGIANRGIGTYAHVLWAGENSIPGTHLLNNFDVLYSHTPITVRTVTFNAQGGTPTPPPQSGLSGFFTTVPNPAPELTDHTLVGWRLSGATTNFDFANTPITSNITLYAEWELAGSGTERDWLRLSNAINTTTPSPANIVIHPAGTNGGADWTDGNTFNLVIQDTDRPDDNTIVTMPITGTWHRIPVSRAVTVEAAAGEDIVLQKAVESNLRHFNVGTANGNLTIGRAGSTGTLIIDGVSDVGGIGGGISVMHDSSLILQNGSVIRNNMVASGGGGVIADNGGHVTMHSGSEISGNTVDSGGGGVQLDWTSTLTMHGGTISGNTTNSTGGGGVHLIGGFNSTFTMYDGLISDNSGGGVSVGMRRAQSVPTFTMYDGTISGNTAVHGAGVNSNGVFNMRGGIISGNIASGFGGGVSAGGSPLLSGEFEMTGGTISGNTAANGGGVSTGNFTMTGGTISSNTAVNGGGISIQEASRGNLTIASAAVFHSNVATAGRGDYGLTAGLAAYPNIRWQGYATGGNSTMPIVSHLLNNFDINHTPFPHTAERDWIRLNNAIQNPDVARIIIHPASASGVTEGQVGDVFNLVIQDAGQTDNIVTVPTPGTTEWSPHVIAVSHAVTIEAAAGANIGLLMDATGRHFRVQGGDFTIGNAGSTGVLTLDGQAVVNTTHRGGLVVLDGTLNMHDGAVITNSNGGVDVNVNATFTMTGGYIIDNIKVNEGGGVVVYNGGIFNMSGGVISGNTSGKGGGVAVWTDGEFTMTGGTISDNGAANGGGVTVWEGGIFTMTGGVIADNTATETGGGVYVGIGGSTFNISGNAVISGNEATWGGGVTVDTDSEFIMSGGTISGNEATQRGGGVHIVSAEFTMTGGEITGNTAVFWGGGVVVDSASEFTMSGGTISDNTARQGGGVWVNNSEFNMSGTAEITGNEAVIIASSGGSGGGVFIIAGATFDMSGGTISGNEANGGGGVFMNFADFEMTGGTISDNEANHGGGVAVRGPFTMSGGTISGNEANFQGGGVLVDGGGDFEMTGGTISGNEATQRGGGVYVNLTGAFEMSGDAVISGNTANMNGGGVFTRDEFTMTGGEISGNTASSNSSRGGGVYVSNTTFEMTGGTISGNEVTRFNGGSGGFGGGVNLSGSEFNMSGDAAINGNDARFGGGVSMSGASEFNMSGNTTINDNDASSGGGVHVSNRNSTFNMSGGTISGNDVSLSGGGVVTSGEFNMSGTAVINGNTADNGAGVVISHQGEFNMSGGTMSGNIAEYYGGGVDVGGSGAHIGGGTFNMTGGVISNNDAPLGGGVFVWPWGGGSAHISDTAQIINNTAQHGGGLWVQEDQRQTRLTIASPAVFNGNVALAGVFNYGLADGLANYTNIRWQGYATGQNSILGSHLLNNYDINNDVHNPDDLVVTFVGNGGTVYNAPQHSFMVADGTVLSTGQIPALPNVARTGHTFLGWSETATAGSALVTDWSFAITQNRTFYAQWTPTGGGNNNGGNGSNGGSGSGGGGGTTVIQDEDVPLAEIHSHFAYLIGYEDGTVRPRNNITRAEIATIFFRLMPDGDRASHWSQTNPYSDVALAQWFNNAVSTTTNADMFIGFPDGTFRPNSAITRAELAAVIARMMGVTNSGDPMFNDIDGHWAQGYINAAAQNGWAVGYEGLGGRFLPNQPITRAEAAAMINRAFDRLPESAEDLLPGMLTWPDNANPNAWYYLYIQEATNSHTYVMKANGVNETWEELIQTRPWALLERPGSRPEDIFRTQN